MGVKTLKTALWAVLGLALLMQAGAAGAVDLGALSRLGQKWFGMPADTPKVPLARPSARSASATATATATMASADVYWFDDALPAGAVQGSSDDSWVWVSASPAPFSGALAHQSANVAGMHQHYFQGATSPLTPTASDTLFVYVYLDPANPPSQVMLQWNDGSWEHRAYWGESKIDWGTEGTASRRSMGALPPTGQWVRLEVPASLVGLAGRSINGMAFTLYGGRAWWDATGMTSQATLSGTITAGGQPLAGVDVDGGAGSTCTSTDSAGAYVCTVSSGYSGSVTPILSGYSFTPPTRTYSNVGASLAGQDFVATAGMSEVVWVEDAVPPGAAQDGAGESWVWTSSNPLPYSGSLAHASALASGMHQHYFASASNTLPVGVGDSLFVHVYLDPGNPPSELMLQWNDGSWEHRAYWGANQIAWGTDGSSSRRYMGSLPAAGGWVKLVVPAAQVGLEGRTLNGMAFTLYGGRAFWDRAGKLTSSASTFTLSGQVLSGAQPLVGVPLVATNGASCTNTDSSGQYACTVPASWSGSVSPVLAGYDFSPASRSYTAVSANAGGQNYVATSAAESVWFDDAPPTGAALAGSGDAWSWISTAPAPYSGALAHGSATLAGAHQHYFYDASAWLAVAAGDTLFTYVYLDPANPPTELMLQWNDGSWEHRAYWGVNQINWGTDGTASRRYMGPLPPTGTWVRLEVPAAQVGLEGRTLNGMAFTLYGGRAVWDRAGKLGGGTSSYSLSGRVLSAGLPLSGVAFEAGAGASCGSTDATGAYSCAVPSGWSGTITPRLAGYSFTPASRSYSGVTSSQSGQSFDATVAQLRITGSVTSGSAPLASVALAASNGGVCTATDASGNYACTVPYNWSGTVTPALAGYTFTPASRSFTAVLADQAGQGFAATSTNPGAPALVRAVSAPADGAPQLGPLLTVTPPSGVVAGDLLVLIVQSPRAGNNDVLLTSHGGQRWSSYDASLSPNAMSYVRVFWARFSGSWSDSLVVRSPDGATGLPLTAQLQVYRASDQSKWWVPDNWGYSTPGFVAPGSPGTVTLPGITTVKPETVSIAVWAAAGTPTWSGLTGANWRQTSLGTQSRNTGGTGLSLASAYQFRTTAGATGDVALKQGGTSTEGAYTVVSFAAVDLPQGGVSGVPIARVQSKSMQAGGPDSMTLSFDAPVSSGNMVVGYLYFETWGTRIKGPIVDDKGNEYTVIQAASTTEVTQIGVLFFRPNITNAPRSITVTVEGGPAMFAGMLAHEVRGKFALDAYTGDWLLAGDGFSPGVVSTTQAMNTSGNGDYIFCVAETVAQSPLVPYFDFSAWASSRVVEERRSSDSSNTFASADVIQPAAGPFTCTAAVPFGLTNFIMSAAFRPLP